MKIICQYFFPVINVYLFIKFQKSQFQQNDHCAQLRDLDINNNNKYEILAQKYSTFRKYAFACKWSVQLKNGPFNLASSIEAHGG